MAVTISTEHTIDRDEVVELYRTREWASADKPEQLYLGLLASHTLVTAWDVDRLVGLANSLSDGHLVVYYPHMIVHPEYARRGIGRRMMDVMHDRYSGFHQQVLVADGEATEFYRACGFQRAGSCEPMWIYDGTDHG